MAEHHNQIDAVTGTPVTGHEWDGIKELNTPLPRWWVWLFYITIVWSIGYWVVYPSWPLVSSNLKGMIGYASRVEVEKDLDALRATRSTTATALEKASLADVEKDPALLTFARAMGRAAFGDNCAPCHGTGATGSIGYPNLNDDDWLWGGKLEDVYQTIQFGIRSGHDNQRFNQMPAFGRDKILTNDEIAKVANYVRSLSGLQVRQGVDIQAGAKIFAENCIACHGENAKGNPELGAPNLTDAIWLYGSDEAAVIETITNARAGVMPSWTGRLDPLTIKALAVYVHTLGGGK